jgi:hypothetical protein
MNKIGEAFRVCGKREVTVHNTGVPDGATVTELGAIRSLAALVSLPLMEDDIAHLASALRRLSAAAQPLLPNGYAFTPDPTLFDPR